MQVKGRDYRLSELLCDKKWADDLEGGTYVTLYLSPRDYHRFHAPCDLHVVEGVHVPGRLWPVNLWAVRYVEELFCVNERVVLKAKSTSQNTEPFAIIAVGATMVGKVKLEFDDNLTTNRPGGRYLKRSYLANLASFSKGKELGRFEFGSTLVVVYPKNAGSLDTRPPGTPVLLGQKIGLLNHVSK
jgi:phosphatidylserine decarboxylase